jgi:DNA primase
MTARLDADKSDSGPEHRFDHRRGPPRVLHVMTARRLHLTRVKEQASFQQILDHYGVKTRGAGSKRMALCPFHPDTQPSCSIHLERNVFHCFGCGAKGSVLDFVAQIENVSILEAAERIDHLCRIRHDQAVTQKRAQKHRPDQDASDRPLRPLPFRLTLDPSHPYLTGRHISPEIITSFGLGYCSRGTMKGRICIPIHDERGMLVAYAGRWAGDELPDDIPKYDLPCRFPKRRVLFNLHRVAGAEHLVLVEGYWSVFRLHALGIAAVALMGRALSDEQEALLIKSGARMLTLMLDGDGPGRQAADQLLPRLAERFFVRAVRLPDHEKPDIVPEQFLRSVLCHRRPS